MEDLNEVLKRTITAPIDNGESSELWIRRGKKSHREGEHLHEDVQINQETNNKHKEAKLEDSTQIKYKEKEFSASEIRHKIEMERQKEVKKLNARSASVTALSAQNSSCMAYNIIQYMFTHELGGKHNTRITNIEGGNDLCNLLANFVNKPNEQRSNNNSFNDVNTNADNNKVVTQQPCEEYVFANIRADIVVEHAARSAISNYSVQHIINRSATYDNVASEMSTITTTAATTAAKIAPLCSSSAHITTLPNDVIEYRRSLEPCSVSFDLDGGWTGMCGVAQLPVELRRRIRGVIFAGLQRKPYFAQAGYEHLHTCNDNNSNSSNDNDESRTITQQSWSSSFSQTNSKNTDTREPVMHLFEHTDDNDKTNIMKGAASDDATDVTSNNDNDGGAEFAIDEFLHGSNSSEESSTESCEEEEEEEELE